jgi:hypothetical protein
VTERWVCRRHGYVECSRCEPPSSQSMPPNPPRLAATLVTPSSPRPATRSRAEEIGWATLDRLERHRETVRAHGQVLESDIEALLSLDFGPERGRAARVLKRLTAHPTPALRTVQLHIRRITQRQKPCATP